jgi:glycosyltransferase involved in cell wall biosynthesis
MIVKNEEEALGRCLQSCAGGFDEIIIVDTGSEDRTLEIARHYTRSVFSYEWDGDFSAARNFSFSKATGEYIMWLDADDIMLSSDLYKFKILKKVMPRDIDIVMMKYNAGFDEAGHVTTSYYRERLIRRESGLLWQDPVHEFIPISGRVINADVSVTHRPFPRAQTERNLNIYRRMLQEGAEFTPRNMLYFARELRDNGLYDEAVEQYIRFLSTDVNWAEDYVSACFELSFLFQNMGEMERTLGVLLSSFRYATPGAEILCRIGEYHFEKKNYPQAIFWYELALKLEKPFTWRFIHEDYWGYIPALQLCLCHYNLGDPAKAASYNLIAKRFKPDDPSVVSNEKFFAGLKLR